MIEEKDTKVIKQVTEQEIKDNKKENEVKEKKKDKGLKIAAGVGGAVIATGLLANALVPNVVSFLINQAEDVIYDVTKLSFDINGDFNAGDENETLTYGPYPAQEENEGVGVAGF